MQLGGFQGVAMQLLGILSGFAIAIGSGSSMQSIEYYIY